MNEDVNRIIMYGYYDAYFVQERNGVKMIRTERDGSCIFHNKDNGLCDIYPSRPERCKLLPYTTNESETAGIIDPGCRYAHDAEDDPQASRRMVKYLNTLHKEIQWRREHQSHLG